MKKIKIIKIQLANNTFGSVVLLSDSLFSSCRQLTTGKVLNLENNFRTLFFSIRFIGKERKEKGTLKVLKLSGIL